MLRYCLFVGCLLVVSHVFALIDLSSDDTTRSHSQASPVATKSADSMRWGRTVVIVDHHLSGRFTGGALGQNMDLVDSLRLNEFFESAKAKQKFSWTNDHTGEHFNIVAGAKSYAQGQVCRAYQAIVSQGRSAEHYQGDACRAGDGNWHLSSNEH